MDNVVPCCGTCNNMKNSMSLECFKMQIANIYKKSVLHESINYNDPRTNIITMLTQSNIKCHTYKPLRLVKEPSYYCSQIYNGTITDVSNMKIKIEFVESSNKIPFSIWQFYRRYISSFRKQKGSTLVGRRVYMLVKDEITNNYLGIISLSSDIKYLKARDAYIGWKCKESLVNGKLNYIMNISTCVSTQPFGYNYNGGKLLTSLVFSKEVLTHIKEKYNICIQGFTTMSLYGKSVQYDRIPYVKFIGYTSGSSLVNIPNDVAKYCKKYLRENNHSVPNDNLWCITKAFKQLSIPIEDFLKSCKKGIYFGYTHSNSKQFLHGKLHDEPNSIETAPAVNAIYNWWLTRWAKQRYSHLQKNNRIKKYSECMDEIMQQIQN